MSYLSSSRISFAGRFLSDVSTRNNVDANYKPGAAQQNLWNASGGASVELLDCGALISGSIEPGDTAAGFVITGAIDKPSGKMVDLDPDWQMASQVWSMHLRIADRKTGALAVEGKMAVCAFRDLWSRQFGGPIFPTPVNGQPVGARYVSVLGDVTWGPAAQGSAAMQALKASASNGRLSVGWHVFGYFYPDSEPRYRTGSLMLHIGPHSDREPETMLMHRRIQGFSTEVEVGGQQFPFAVTGDIDFAVAKDGTSSHFDIGQGLLLSDVDGHLLPFSALPNGLSVIQKLFVGFMPQGLPQLVTPVPPDDIFHVFDIPNDPDWYRQTGGVVSSRISAEIQAKPLVLFAQLQGGAVIAVATETTDGIYYRAEDFVQRLETGDTTTVTIHARKFGQPFAGLQLHAVQVRPGGGGPAPTVSPLPPTDAQGVTRLAITGTDPGAPRRVNALDGEVYAYQYGHKLRSNGTLDMHGTGLGGLDVIVVHVRDPFPVPDTPNFERDIQPFMAQYAQLYPVMSQHLFDISDYDALVAYRQAMLLAFSRDIGDPNYMPVTRDMSRGRSQTLVKWLSNVTDNADEPLLRDRTIAVASMDIASKGPVLESEPPGEREDIKRAMGMRMAQGTYRPIMPASALERLV